MNQLLTQLRTNDFTLLVSLPQNNVTMARAALENGAQGLKVHVNVEHFASGTKFGAWNEEREIIAQIVELARDHSASVGIVPGARNGDQTPFAGDADFAEMAKIGVDYFDAYPADAPAWTLSQTNLDVMMAAYCGGEMDELRVLETLGMTLCEASVLSHDEYGQSLSARDLAKYSALCAAVKSPVIVPSQKALTPRDLPFLRAAGARGVLIGAIVTGREVSIIADVTRQFAHALAQ